MAYPGCPLTKNGLKEGRGWLCDLSTLSNSCTAPFGQADSTFGPQREQKHLVARTRFGIGGFLVAAAQLGQRQFIQLREGDGSGRPLCDSQPVPNIIDKYNFSPSYGITSSHTLLGSI